MDDINEFLREEIKKAIPERFKTQTALAEAAGLKQSYINMIMNGKREPSLSIGFKIIQALRLPIIKNNSTITRIGMYAPLEELDEANQSLIDLHIYATAGAGQAWDLVEDDPIKTIRIPQSYMEQVDFALLVDGDSMVPTLKHGSIVGIRQDYNYTQSEVYAIRLPDEGLSIKRISKNHVNKSYIVRSDNLDQQKYPPYEIPMLDNDNFIVGRVMWVWQNI